MVCNGQESAGLSPNRTSGLEFQSRVRVRNPRKYSSEFNVQDDHLGLELPRIGELIFKRSS